MPRMDVLSKTESAAICKAIEREGVTLAEMARRLGRDKSALYRLLHRRHGLRVGHSMTGAWSATLEIPEDAGVRGYIAGLIDGEGSIVRRSSDQSWHLKVGMTDESVIRWLAQFGGKFHPQKPRNGRLPVFHWDVNRKRDVLYALESVRPYLIVKATSADSAIADLRARLCHD